MSAVGGFDKLLFKSERGIKKLQAKMIRTFSNRGTGTGGIPIELDDFLAHRARDREPGVQCGRGRQTHTRHVHPTTRSPDPEMGLSGQ